MAAYRRIADLPQVIPVFPLDGALLLPGGDRVIGMIQTKSGGSRDRPPLADVGCAGRITAYAETSDGRYLITLTGVCRFHAGEELNIHTPYRQMRALYDRFESDLSEPGEAQAPPALRARFAQALKRYLNRRELDIDWETAQSAPLEALVDSLAAGLPFGPAEKQALLEAPTLTGRFETLSALLEMDSADDGDDDSRSLQ